MSILNRWKSLDNYNLKYCNLAILSFFGLVQSARCIYNRYSSDALESYLRSQSSNSTLHSSTSDLNKVDLHGFEEKRARNSRVRLKKIDSNKFWAVLEDQTTKEQIYMKLHQQRHSKVHFGGLMNLKNEPYLIKKKIFEIFSREKGPSDGSREWVHVKSVAKPSIDLEHTHGELLSLVLIAVAGLSTIGWKSINYVKTAQCISFIKKCCKQNPRVRELVGERAVLRNLDGELRTNYFNGDAYLSGRAGEASVKLVVIRDQAHAPFKLLTFKVNMMQK